MIKKLLSLILATIYITLLTTGYCFFRTIHHILPISYKQGFLHFIKIEWLKLTIAYGAVYFPYDVQLAVDKRVVKWVAEGFSDSTESDENDFDEKNIHSKNNSEKQLNLRNRKPHNNSHTSNSKKKSKNKPKKNRIILSNHVTNYDWLFVLTILDHLSLYKNITIILKHSLSKIPIFGQGMKMFGYIFVKRNWEEDETVIRQAVRGTDIDLLVFPEGTIFTKYEYERSVAYQASIKSECKDLNKDLNENKDLNKDSDKIENIKSDKSVHQLNIQPLELRPHDTLYFTPKNTLTPRQKALNIFLTPQVSFLINLTLFYKPYNRFPQNVYNYRKVYWKGIGELGCFGVVEGVKVEEIYGTKRYFDQLNDLNENDSESKENDSEKNNSDNPININPNNQRLKNFNTDKLLKEKRFLYTLFNRKSDLLTLYQENHTLFPLRMKLDKFKENFLRVFDKHDKDKTIEDQNADNIVNIKNINYKDDYLFMEISFIRIRSIAYLMIFALEVYLFMMVFLRVI